MKFFRILFGVVLGYLSIAISLRIAMTAAAWKFGADRVFVAESWQLSDIWNALSCVLSLVAAFLGGVVAAWWGGRRLAGTLLAIVIVVLGTLTLFVAITRPAVEAPPRPVVMTLSDWEKTGQYSIQPMWMLLVTPVLSVIGVVAGTRYIARRQANK